MATTSMRPLKGCTMAPHASASVVGGLLSSTALRPCALNRSAASSAERPAAQGRCVQTSLTLLLVEVYAEPFAL